MPQYRIFGAAGPPVIEAVDHSSTTTTITLTWTTTEAATSVVYYGTSQSYGGTASVSGYATQHSVTISNLSAATLYYYQIHSEDTDGNEAQPYSAYTSTAETDTPEEDSEEPTATPQPTSVLTPTRTPTPTPTPIPDSTAPTIQIQPLTKTLFRDPPTISVAVQDIGGIASLQYSVNNKTYKVISTPLSPTKTSVSVTFIPPETFTSGIYTVTIRARDTANNISTSSPLTFTIDKDPPQLRLTTQPDPVVEIAPTLHGIASDPSGIAKIEYSYTDTPLWQPLMSRIIQDVNEFEVTLPDPTQEGRYSILLRSSDSLGNTATIGPYALSVDRLPPRIGGALVRVFNILVPPQSVQNIRTIKEIPHTLLLSAAGGVTRGKVILTSADGYESRHALAPSQKPGFWETSFTPSQSGVVEVWVELTDGIHDMTRTSLFTLDVHEPSCVTPSSPPTKNPPEVTLESFDVWRNTFVLWDADSYNQRNPIVTPDGCYTYLVPKGTYRLKATSGGYNTVTTNQFTVDKTSFVSSPLTLSRASCVTFPFFRWCLPWLDQTEVVSSQTATDTSVPDAFTPSRLPDSLASAIGIGKDAILVLTNSWMPNVTELIDTLQQESTRLSKPIVVVFPFEDPQYVDAWRRQVGYTIPIFADPDGAIVTAADSHVWPVVLAISADGFITQRAIAIQHMFAN